MHGVFRQLSDLATRLVFTQVISRTKVAREALEALEGMTEDQGAVLLETRIHSRVAWKMSSTQGLAVTEWEPKGAAAGELMALWAELGFEG